MKPTLVELQPPTREVKLPFVDTQYSKSSLNSFDYLKELTAWKPKTLK